MANSNEFTGVQVFSATKQLDRDDLGNRITEWLAANPGITIVDKIVKQSSDSEFHCLSCTIFFTGKVTSGPRALTRRTNYGS